MSVKLPEPVQSEAGGLVTTISSGMVSANTRLVTVAPFATSVVMVKVRGYCGPVAEPGDAACSFVNFRIVGVIDAIACGL